MIDDKKDEIVLSAEAKADLKALFKKAALLALLPNPLKQCCNNPKENLKTLSEKYNKLYPNTDLLPEPFRSIVEFVKGVAQEEATEQ